MTPVRAASIVVDSSTAQATFPDSLSFSLQAHADQPITHVSVRYRVGPEQTERLVLTEISPALVVDVVASESMLDVWIPPGIDIRYHWRIETENGELLRTEEQVVAWRDGGFDWKEYATEDVAIFSYFGDESFNQWMLQMADDAVQQLQVDYDIETLDQVRIWVYQDTRDYSRANPPNSVEWSAGAAYPKWSVIYAVIGGVNEYAAQRIIPHELSHQVLFQSARNPFNQPPLWIDEGLAVAKQPVGTEGHRELVMQARENDELFSLASLKSNFPYQADSVTLAYAQSYCVVRYMKTVWGEGVVMAIIEGYRQSLSHDEVLMQAIGLDTAGLDAQWRAADDSFCG